MKLLLLILCLLAETATDVISVAKTFLGVPYVAGTLEKEGEERLVIDEKQLDCTTFVELSVARWLVAQSDTTSFEREVQHLRYRGGEVDGYLSRLHYFTDWVLRMSCEACGASWSPKRVNQYGGVIRSRYPS